MTALNCGNKIVILPQCSSSMEMMYDRMDLIHRKIGSHLARNTIMSLCKYVSTVRV